MAAPIRPTNQFRDLREPPDQAMFRARVHTYVITHNGTPVAALVPIADFEALEEAADVMLLVVLVVKVGDRRGMRRNR